MRPVLAIDLMCAGRALLLECQEHRAHLAAELVSRTMIADRHRIQTGALHPEFGGGTLADAARLFGMVREPTVCNPEFAEALVNVLQALIRAGPTNHRVSK